MSTSLDTLLKDKDLILEKNQITCQYDFLTIRFCGKRSINCP